MSLDLRYVQIRAIVNDCIGYRILDDDDVIRQSDETVRGSMLESGNEGWTGVGDSDFRDFVGRRVKDMNSVKHNREMDCDERLFRRKLHGW